MSWVSVVPDLVVCAGKEPPHLRLELIHGTELLRGVAPVPVLQDGVAQLVREVGVGEVAMRSRPPPNIYRTGN